jgi:glycosyltransferase involved in cell wall biosynthesis
MRLLLVHQNFPGQFKHLATALAERGHEVVALGAQSRPQAVPGVRVLAYPLRRGTTPKMHPWATSFEANAIYAEAVGQAAESLRKDGFSPDVIYGHAGWGECLPLKTIWPHAKLIGFFEYYYRAMGADVNFDPEFPGKGWTDDLSVEMKNAGNLLTMQAADGGITPTQFQLSTFPTWFQPHLKVIHDGVDTAAASPEPNAVLKVGNLGKTFRPGDEIITFVSRRLEPLRGYHVFMRALPEILSHRPRAHVLIVGADDEPGYGANPPAGKTWRQVFLDEVKHGVDLSRVLFLGRVPYEAFVAVLRVSAAHVYLSYPFVLSWSLLEALSAGCLVIASGTAPVREAIEDGKNGRLVDFFDTSALATAVVEALSRPNKFRKMRSAARQGIVARYDLKTICLPKQITTLESYA